MQPGSFVSRVDAENDTDQQRESKSECDHVEGHGEAHIGDQRNLPEQSPGNQQADQAADDADDHGFDQKRKNRILDRAPTTKATPVIIKMKTPLDATALS